MKESTRSLVPSESEVIFFTPEVPNVDEAVIEGPKVGDAGVAMSLIKGKGPLDSPPLPEGLDKHKLSQLDGQRPSDGYVSRRCAEVSKVVGVSACRNTTGSGLVRHA